MHGMRRKLGHEFKSGQKKGWMILNSGEKRVGQRSQKFPPLRFATRQTETSRHCGVPPKQMQRPPRLRERAARGRGSRQSRGRGRRCCERGQQGAEEVAGAEAEAAEVAGGAARGRGSRRSRGRAEVAGGDNKGQRKSPEQRQRPPSLGGAARVRGSRRSRGRGRRSCRKGQQEQRKSPEQRHLLSLPQRAVSLGLCRACRNLYHTFHIC